MATPAHNSHGGDAAAAARTLGLKETPEVRLDFSVNINPLGAPPSIHAVLSRAKEKLAHYPPAEARGAASSLAQAHGVAEDSVIVGNGSTEILGWILQALRPARAAWVAPCYVGYAEVCRACGVDANGTATTSARDDFAVHAEHLAASGADLLFLGSPNNPTGTTIPRELVLSLAREAGGRCFVVDESFVDFTDDPAAVSLIRNDLPENLIVVKSLTKFFAIPGLRLGMACAAPPTIERLGQVRLPWSVNVLAQAAACRVYEDADYTRRSRLAVKDLREKFILHLSGLPGVTVYPSAANFLLVRLPSSWTACRLQAALLERGILIRSCADFEGLDAQFCRLAVRPRREIEELLAVLRPLLTGDKSHLGARLSSRPRTPAIMVVGTASNSGKSVVAAGLCRYFARRGDGVAPFKAQNMSLNSFVTHEGGEMGRAQVVQAQAAGIRPHTDMNPVLLKPTGEKGSQVIVDGQPIGNLTAGDYYAIKERMRKSAHAAYDRLARRYELIVLEGAGSPAEINLQAEDFVNMDMAAYAGADALLVADIDRGGVFASILGTVELLPAEHRHLIRGIVINKFRGDLSLLEPGLKSIENLTGIPVLGVLPFVRDLRIEDEDSLGLEGRSADEDTVIDIVVVRVPRISNFTDFLAFERTAKVRVRYVASVTELGDPDLIVLPGSKNTRSDLQHLHDTGWFDALRRAVSERTPVFGICGGYQMLGRKISDPDGVEDEPGESAGLGFLPLETVLCHRKELAQVQGAIATSLPFAAVGTRFEGYEIHSGQTRLTETIAEPLTVTRRRGQDSQERAGAVSENGFVFGCYVHGLFADPAIRSQLLRWLCANKGISAPEEWTDGQLLPDEIDRVADLLAQHLDMARICGWITGS